MTTQFTMDPTDQFRENSFNVKDRWRLVLSWRVAAGALAIVGLTASALYFAYFAGRTVDGRPTSIFPSVAMNAQANIAATAEPPVLPVAQAPAPTQVAEPRAGRIALASALEPPQAKIVTLQDDDPRWGHATADEKREAAVPEPIKTAELRAKLERLQDPTPAGQAAVTAAMDKPEPTDANPTGAIPARVNDRSASVVDAAQPATAAVAAVQTSPADDQVAAASVMRDEPAPVAMKEAGKPAASTRTAKVTTHVNMRAGPENEAAVLTVVPAGGSVQVIGCDMWCEIDFDGRRGWVFKSFIADS